MSFSAPDDHELLKAEVGRLRADKEDGIRRIRERDERSTDLMRQLDIAQKKVTKTAETLATERVELQKIRNELSAAKATIDDQYQTIQELKARRSILEGQCRSMQEQLTQSQEQLEVTREENTRLEERNKSVETNTLKMEGERDAAKQNAEELNVAKALAEANVGVAKQAAVSMVEMMARERDDLRQQRDVMQARLEYERVEHANGEARRGARREAERLEWQATREAALHDLQRHLVLLQEKLRQAQSENGHLEVDRQVLERDAARGRAAADMARAFTRHCRCQAPFVIPEGRHQGYMLNRRHAERSSARSAEVEESEQAQAQPYEQAQAQPCSQGSSQCAQQSPDDQTAAVDGGLKSQPEEGLRAGPSVALDESELGPWANGPNDVSWHMAWARFDAASQDLAQRGGHDLAKEAAAFGERTTRALLALRTVDSPLKGCYDGRTV